MLISINGRFLLQDVTGVQKVALELVKAIDHLIATGAAPGLDVDLWVPSKGALTAQPDLSAVRLRRAGHLSGHLWEQLELPRLAGGSPLLCLGNVAPVSRLVRRRARTYTMVHGLSFKYFPDAYSRTFRLLYGIVIPLVLARSTHVFTVSESERSAILRCFGRLVTPEQLTAAQNGGGEPAAKAAVTEDPSSLESGAKGVPSRRLRSLTCLYVGSITKVKNAEGLAKAVTLLAQEDPDLEFVFVGSTGSSFQRVGISLATEHRRRCRFLGQLNDPQQVERWYRECLVFLFPSLYEASPLPPIEAMSHGCPVVAGDIPSLRERCGDAALYADPGDAEGLARQVRSLMASETLWSSLQRRGLDRARTYSWSEQARRILDVIAATPLMVAAWPTRRNAARNAFQKLLHDEMERSTRAPLFELTPRSAG